MEQRKAPTKVEAVKLPWKVKFLYATGDIAKSVSVIMTVAFCSYFYTEVCKLNTGVTATIIFIGKVWDIIFNPIMGMAVDRTKSKEGRCRVWLKYMSVPAAVIFALTFMVPELSMSGKIVYVAVTYLLQGMMSTALIIPMNTLQGRLTADPVERAQISQIKGMLNVIPNLTLPAATIPMVMFFGQDDLSKGFMIVSLIYAVIYCVFCLTVYFGTRGYEPVEYLSEDTTLLETKHAKQPLGAVLKALLKNPPWLLCIALYLMDIVFVTIASQSMTWYYQYNIGSIKVMSLVSSVSTFTGLLVYVIVGFLIKRFGNSGTAAIGCLISVLGYGTRFLFHDSSVFIILGGSIVHNFGAELVASTIVLCIFDARVYGEWKTGVDNEAILMSGYSISYKIGQAVGAPLAGYLLLIVPYVAQAAVQEQSVLNLWFYETTLMPAIGFAVAFVFALILKKYEKRVPQMRAEIEARTK